MKKIYFLFGFLIISTVSFSQEPFITTWEISGNLTVNILISNDANNFSYDYTIDFGDGTVQSNVTGSITHQYLNPGIYTITISGSFPKFSTAMPNNLLSIEQWGDIIWQDMTSAFYNCNNLIINATDAPNLTQVTSLSRMFNSCDNFDSSINHWDVSNITDMSLMFATTYFNQPLNNWDVSNVTNMQGMFAGCHFFNQSLESWNVSSVINMNSMFTSCTSFNQPLDNWDVSNVTDMKKMFQYTDEFNQPLNNWDVSNVTDMNRMFFDSNSFDNPLNNWDVSNVIDMNAMFASAPFFNRPLNNWNVSNVSNFGSMFSGATNFNQDISNWDISNVQTMSAFLNNTNLDVSYYDSFLANLANYNITNISLGANNLNYCNSSARDYLINNLEWNIVGDTLSSDCNIINGSVFYDQNNDGCNNNDILSEGFFTYANNGDFNSFGLVSNGVYSISVVGNSFSLSLVNVPNYFTASPESVTVNFTSSSTEQVDFCLTANQVVEDLNITILPLDDARPGFESNYKLVVQNVGTETLNVVTANVVFDDTKQSFVSANPTATNTTANTLNFNIGTIQPFGSVEIEFVMQTLIPPTVNGGDVLNFVATVLPNTSDYTPNDNTFTFDQIVVNSFDPNDKRVLQGDFITIDETNDYLDYIIRFQNTGSANATFVRIEDVLDPELDWNTLKITSASHAYDVKITNGNEVEFLFDNINLPYEAADEPNSHGYIAYKIKPKTTVQLGDVFSGDARIYFDYNLPIITNTVSTTVVESLGVNEYEKDTVSIYPNPFNDIIYINSKNGVEVNTIKIIDMHGKVLIKSDDGADKIKTDQLSSGIYLLSIKTSSGMFISKIIKN